VNRPGPVVAGGSLLVDLARGAAAPTARLLLAHEAVEALESEVSVVESVGAGRLVGTDGWGRPARVVTAELAEMSRLRLEAVAELLSGAGRVTVEVLGDLLHLPDPEIARLVAEAETAGLATGPPVLRYRPGRGVTDSVSAGLPVVFRP
jgi:hypothetical protein